MTYFQRILENFERQNEDEELVINEEEIIFLLQKLNYNQQDFIAKKFQSMTWNVGSLIILNILQSADILSISEYFLSLNKTEENFEHIQHVLSDILETRNHQLLTNIITNCAYNSSNIKLITYLEETIRRLIIDFTKNENLIYNNYFKNISYLEDDAFSYFCNMHVNLLLELDSCKAEEALGKADAWKCNISKCSNFYKFLNDASYKYNFGFFIQSNNLPLIQLINTNKTNVTNLLLQHSLYPNFRNWKYLIIILGIVSKMTDSEIVNTIKKHLRETFKKAIIKGSLNLLLCVLILARTVCANEENSLFETYSQWYKNNVCDLKYLVSVKQDFLNAIMLLTKIIDVETDTKYLEIHSKMTINPFARCNEEIIKYKNQCQQKITTLSKETISDNNLMEIEDIFDSQYFPL